LADVTVTYYADTTFTQGAHQSYVVLGKVGGFETLSPSAGLALALSVSAAPALPGNLTALALSSGLKLQWDAQTQAKQYWVYRSTAALGAVPGIAPLATVTAASYTDLSADPAMVYQYGVAAMNELALGGVSAIAVTPAPGVVLNLSVTAGYVSGSQVDLTWGAPAAPALATSYEVHRATEGGAFDAGNSTLLANVTTTTYVDSGLLTGTAYYYQVRSMNLISSTANLIKGPVRAHVLPGVVQGVSATGAVSRVDVIWDVNDSAEGVTGYAVTVIPDPNFGGTYSARVIGHSYSVTNLAAAQGVTVSVTALNSAGGSAAAVTVFAVANSVGPAAQATTFSASVGFFETSDATLRVVLSWSGTALGQTVLVYKSTQPIPVSVAAGGTASPLYLTGVSGLFQSLTDATVSGGQSYYYALTVLGAGGLPGGESMPLRSAAVEPFSYPERVTLNAQAGTGRIDVYWTEPIYKGTSGSLADPAYRLYRYVSSLSYSAHTAQAPDAGFPVAISTTSYTDLAVTNGVTYQYVLAVVDASGREQQGRNLPCAALRTPRGSLAAPTGVVAIPGDNAVTLRFLAARADTAFGLKYNVYRRVESGGDYGAAVPGLYLSGPSSDQEFGNQLQTLVTLRDSASPAPVNKTGYCYTLSLVNQFGESGRSQEVCTTPYRPLAPTLGRLTLSVTGKKDVQLTWDPTVNVDVQADNLDGFRLYRSQDGGTTYATLVALLPLTSTSYTDVGTEFGASYVYRLVPVDVQGREGISYDLASVIIPSAKNAVLLFRNSFNPAGGEVVPVQFSLLQPGHAWVRVYTLQGDFVVSLFEEDVAQASADNPYLSQKKAWDGKNSDGQTVASGVYLVHLEALGYRANARVAVIK